MLKVDEIIYPITFDLKNESKSITYTDPSTGSYADGDRTELKVSFFVNAHNKHNPENDKNKKYYYEMAEKKENNPGGYFFAKDGQMNLNGSFFTASIVRPGCDMFCNIEDMPVGSTIKGIKNDDGEFDAITFKAKRVEIYDDVITLLSGYAGGSMPKRTQTYAAELNIKRGTLVKYSTNC